MPDSPVPAVWHQRIVLTLPWLILAWVGLMLASLNWSWLDIFVIGSWHGATGLDYFSVPRAWDNLVHGVSIYRTDESTYGPYATWFPYHPAVAVAIGSWARQLPPLQSYLTFVGVSVSLLTLSGWVLARQATDPLIRRLCYACLLGSLPTYLMLFIGQMHVFTVLALALVLAGMWQLQSVAARDRRQGEWQIAAGLLAALLTKPVAAIFLPTLLLMRETRRATLSALGVYAAVSATFLFIPPLNPGGLNFIHWTNIVAVGHGTHSMANFGRVNPRPMSHDPEIFSLPTWCDHLAGVHFNPHLFKLPLAAVFVLSALVAWRKESDRLRLAILCVILATCSYYLGYPCVWEYHYTTLLPCVAMLVLMLSHEADRARRRTLTLALVLGAMLYLPTPYFLYRGSPLEYMALCRAVRILPVLGIYIVLLADVVRSIRTSLPTTQAEARQQVPPVKSRRPQRAGSR